MSSSIGLATSGLLDAPSLGSSGYVDEGVVIDNPQEEKTNLFRDADLFVNAQRNASAQVPLVYIRLEDGIEIETCGSIHMTVFRFNNRFNQSIRYEGRDFIFNTSDLLTDDVRFVPAKGDLIYEDTILARFIYEVSSINDEPVYKYSGAYRQGIRVHTKMIDKEDGFE